MILSSDFHLDRRERRVNSAKLTGNSRAANVNGFAPRCYLQRLWHRCSPAYEFSI
jgi:hypothetical protein